MTSITAAMCARGRSLSEPRLSPDGRRVAVVTRDGNGTRLVTVPTEGGPEVVVSTDPAPAFRGGVFDWMPDGSELVFATGAGDLVLTPSEGGPAVVPATDVAAASVAVGPDRRIAYAADLARIEVLGHGVVSDAADFCLDATWSPDGARLAWHEWDVPDMPWDASRIVVLDDGTRTVVAGGGDIAVQQPRFSPDGTRLAFLCDATGWLNLWTADAAGGGATVLVDEPFEHGGPTWGPGQRTFAWSPDGRTIAFARNEAGFGRLCTVDVASGRVTERARGVHAALTWVGSTLVAVRSGARTPTAVVAYDEGMQRRPLLRGPAGGFERAAVPEPEVVHWGPRTGVVAHGRLFGDAPGKPLLVWVHGGPTDQRMVEFDARLAYFLDRGWAVLFPDHRGSTGWGRAYAQALRGGWGIVDVEDVTAAVQRWGRGRRVALMGASAGGFNVLQVLAGHPGLCAAGIALYPVSDLDDLAASTHRYEAHYPQHMLGVKRVDAERIVDPLLLLHGADDVVVPAAQSASLAERIRAAGGTVEHHQYEGEGHGWGRPATIEDELTRISAFLDRHVLG